MAFVVETGSGVANANSLVSIEQFREYHSDRGNTVAVEMEDDEIKPLLVKATDYFVDVFGSSIGGRKFAGVQALPFPRFGLYVAGVLHDTISVPSGVVAGICELAWIARTGPLLKNVTRGKKMVQVGSLKVEYDGEAPTQTRFVAAALKFAPYIAVAPSGGIGVKLNRV